MPPVNSAPSSDVDNEATAELPVLDVAAYEATLEVPVDTAARTDSWRVSADATTEMPSLRDETIPTLNAAVPAYDLDHSGTHEMPAMHARRPEPARSPPPARATGKDAIASAAPPVFEQDAKAAPAAIGIPPSPPLIEELRQALARAERRIEEVQERARIADAERAVAIARANAECAQLREQIATQVETIATAKERLAVQGTDQAELEDAYFARGDRIAALERALAAQSRTLEDTRQELAASRRHAESLNVDAMNLRATIAHREARIAVLEADLQARQQREAALKARLDEALASVNPDVPGLHAEIARGAELARELKAELALAKARIDERNADLEVAEENIRNLETELRQTTGKLEEASVTVEEWRAVIAESQRSLMQRDTRIHQLEADLHKRVAPAAMDQTGEEIALEGPARVLIRTDGNTEFVHVLGRRTRIGRGPDNEIVLDTKHVSRYHAVLLAGPVNTSIEDLNSTNGVFVNGKRITRQVVRDGDRVTIGRSQFRYTVRD